MGWPHSGFGPIESADVIFHESRTEVSFRMVYYPEASLRRVKLSALSFVLASFLWLVAMATNCTWDGNHPAPAWVQFVLTVAGGLFLPKSLLEPDATFPLHLAPLFAACLGYTLAFLTAWAAPALRLPRRPLLALKLLSIFQLFPLVALYQVSHDTFPPSGPGDLLWLLAGLLFLTATWLSPTRVPGEPFLSLTVLFRNFTRRRILRPTAPPVERGFPLADPVVNSTPQKVELPAFHPAYRLRFAVLAFVVGWIVWWTAVDTPAGSIVVDLRDQPATTGVFIASELNDAVNPFDAPRSSAFNKHPPALPMLLYFVTLAVLWVPLLYRPLPLVWALRVAVLSFLTPAYYLFHPTFFGINTAGSGHGFLFWNVANLILATTPWLIPRRHPQPVSVGDGC